MKATSKLKSRWQPVRSGLVNLFKYQDQVFHYENGHLLLRGDNGSGKSRVLALQLPFLFDGEISPYRVEPDRDPAKRMEWNLLMDKHERRVGYTWIEFGRSEENDDGDEQEYYLTLGCGMDARKGSGAPDRWYFITKGRVGIDFHLVEKKQALSERELISVLERPELESFTFRKASDYRTAVDQALFKLGNRYRPLLDLLIQLRQPQLMRDMKEESLSRALSEALPPISESLVAEVAESFQGLENDRRQTEDHREMLESVETFQEGYRQYLGVAIRRLCDVLRGRHSQFELTARDLRKIETEIESTTEARERAARETLERKGIIESFRAEIEALRSSPEMREKENLDAMRKRASELEADAGHALAEQQRARQTFAEAEEEQASRSRECQTLRGTLIDKHGQLIENWNLLGESSEMSFFDWERDDPSAGKLKVEDYLARRNRNVAHLRQQNRAIVSLQQVLEKARYTLNHARQLRDEAAERVTEKEAQLGGEIQAFGQAVRTWENRLEILEWAPRDAEWEELFTDWLEQRDGPFSLEISIAQGRAHSEKRIAQEEAEAQARCEQLRREKHAFERQLDDLHRGIQTEPDPPYTRDAESRKQREGAPLWKWLEFRAEIPDSERAGWEAALESSGLLDAWVMPNSGNFSFLNDNFLNILSEPELAESESLVAILTASDEAQTVIPLLQRIGNHREAARCWVNQEGHWANGMHFGHFTKAEPALIGAAAREAARLRRITEIEALIHDLQSQLDNYAQQFEQWRAHRSQLAQEVASQPSRQRAVELSIGLERDREDHQKRETELIGAEEAENRAVQQWQAAVQIRDRDGADFGLSKFVETEALERFSVALTQFEKSMHDFCSRWERVLEKNLELDKANARLEQALAIWDGATDREETKRHSALAARKRVTTLLENVGATVEQLLDKLQVAEASVGKAEIEKAAAEKRLHTAEINLGVLEERKGTAQEKRQQSELERDRAVSRMEVFVEKRLFEEWEPTFQPDRTTFSATAAVDLARRLEKELKDQPSDEQHWRQLQSEVAESFREFTDQLGRHGHHPSLQYVDESSVSLIRCEYQTSQHTVRELRDLLSEELANRERIFEEREREIIENHLIGEAALELQQRIRDGEQSVADINAELAKVTSSSGIQLRFVWDVADPSEDTLRSTRRIFLKSAELLTLDERGEIGRFLQNRIRSEREADDTLTWRDHLTKALDYRAWHQFVIERKAGGETTWKKLTKRNFGTGSGGEKALSLTLPQFAAAAAHYNNADPCAPRLILLDEVFVGIDAPTRERLMGLLERFDLDYVMTSEREWGAFPTVSALAIYQLAARAGFNTVAVSRWVWNGREKIRTDDDFPSVYEKS